MASITGEHGGSLADGGVDSWRTNPSVNGGSKPGGSTGDVTLQAGGDAINSGGEF
jgi:hypothetical protein